MNETSLPEFNSSLAMKDITDAITSNQQEFGKTLKQRKIG